MKVNNNVSFGSVIATIKKPEEKQAFEVLKKEFFTENDYTFKLEEKKGDVVEIYSRAKNPSTMDNCVELLLNLAGIKNTTNTSNYDSPEKKAVKAIGDFKQFLLHKIAQQNG